MATSLPVGTSTDAPPTASLYSVLNASEAGLVQSAETLAGAPFDDSAVSGITAPSDLTTTNVPQIVADFTGTTFEGTAPSSTAYATALATDDPTYATDAANTESAGTAYNEIPQLIGLAAFDPSGLFTVNSDVTVSSTATVTKSGNPTADSIQIATSGSAAGGYILPSAFTLKFPAHYKINVGLIGKEIPASAEASPATKYAKESIGSVTIKSPAVQEFGLSSNNTLTGKIYVVSSPSATDPSLELSFATGIYDLGGFGSVSFPLTVSFGETHVPTAISASGTDPLPFSSLALSFPASTSPVEATSCTSLGAVTGTATDNVAALATEFGDTTDGYSSTTNVTSPVNLADTATKVTDKCVVATKLTVSKSGAASIKSGKPSVHFTLADNKAFSSFAVTLPKGFKYSKLAAKDLSISGAKVKSVKVSGSKATITLKTSVKKITAKISKGIATTTKAAKKDKSITVKVTASGKTVSVKAKA